MHPVEYLRSVARSGDSDPVWITVDFILGMSALSQDPAAMVMSSRRMIEKHPHIGQLWWASSRMLTSIDVADEAVSISDELEQDPTWEELEAVIHEPHSAIPAFAVGPESALVGSYALDEMLQDDAERWLVAPTGVVLPQELFDSLCQRTLAARSTHRSGPPTTVSLDTFNFVAGPSGLVEPKVAAHRATCPVASELLETGA